MTRPAKALLLGILTGLSGMLAANLPLLQTLEENTGLDLLFKLRGTRTPPDEVVVVSIDKHSARALNLPEEPSEWPRGIHARLVDELAHAGASVIALDIFFREPKDPGEDRLLAEAIRAAGRVVLFSYTSKEITRIFDASGEYAGEMISQQLVPPARELAEAATATAPFPLPVYPIRVSQYWAFTAATGDNLPTVPVVALQLHARSALPELRALADIRNDAPQAGDGHAPAQGPVEELQTLRSAFRRDPALAGLVRSTLAGNASEDPGRAKRLLAVLPGLYAGPDSRYLNFYGPPQTITTIPYAQLLLPELQVRAGHQPHDLQGKAVFVGYSERLHPEQLDEFYTVYSRENGLNLSGVEIAATAFANLLEDLPVTPFPLPAYYALLLAWGILCGVVLRLLPAVPAILAALVLAAGYLAAGHTLFSSSALWLPLVIPLGLQLPLVLFTAVLWHYLEVHRERETIRSAFGLYLPPQVVDQLAGERANGQAAGQLMHGTCLSTDAYGYTRLSETLPPEALGELMNAYYETLFQPVRRHGGIVSDVIGDAMLAIWASVNREPRIQQQAVLAALEISRILDNAGPRFAGYRLKTRIGLHSGEILLGSIGAVDHYEYRAVGDIVNTSTRIQNMNIHLGTRILLTSEVLRGVEGLRSREVGSFILSGKSRPVVIHELLGLDREPIPPGQADRLERFAAGLAAFRAGDWRVAGDMLEPLSREEDGDGVARFYLGHCRGQQPPADWDGLIRMDIK